MTSVFTVDGMIFRPEPVPDPIFNVDRKTLINDSLMGSKFVVDGSTSESFSAERLTFIYTTIGRTEYFDMITWLDSMAGRRSAFLLPTWRHDFKLALDIAPSDASITIEKMGYNAIYELLLHRRLITIIAANQTMTHDRITGSADLGATERLDFAAALGITAVASETMVCLRPRVRLDKDNIEYNFISESQIGIFNLSFIEVHPFESLPLEPVYTKAGMLPALLDLLGDNDSVLPAVTPSCLCSPVINTIIDLDTFTDPDDTLLSAHVTDTLGDNWLVPTVQDNTVASGNPYYAINGNRYRTFNIGASAAMCPRIDRIHKDDCITIYADLSWSGHQNVGISLALCLDELGKDAMTSDGVALHVLTVNSTTVRPFLERWNGQVRSIANNAMSDPDQIQFSDITQTITSPMRYGIDLRGLVLSWWTADAVSGNNRVDRGSIIFDSAFLAANRDGVHRKVGAQPRATQFQTGYVDNFTVVT